MAELVEFLTGRRFTYAGRPTARGEVMELARTRSDNTLRELGYLAPFKGKTHDCHSCGRRFSSTSWLGAHQLRCGQVSEESPVQESPDPRVCRFCGERFKRSTHRDEHVALNHRDSIEPRRVPPIGRR